MKKILATLLMGALVLGSAQAEDKPAYDRVAFIVSAEKEVPNDTLAAVLYAEQQGQDTKAMADKVNQDINWAMGIAKQAAGVESRTLAYTTNPQYNDGRINGWQVRQSIQLTSHDSKALSELLGNLQEKLRIETINYSVSGELRTSTENELINAALGNFKQRAEQIKANMGRAEYRVVRLDVQSIGSNVPQPMPVYGARAMSVASAPTPPALESGKQNLTVNVQAEIELSGN